ncbi:MAG: ArsR family transcriptional regulator, partial [Nocardioides sp.]|nr:ArsR family transcriptional regulator [Nocardioides sp.]
MLIRMDDQMFRASSEHSASLGGCGSPHVHPERVAAVRARALDESALQQVSSTFKLLGDPTRARLLYALLESGEMCVCDLAAATDVTG